MTLALRDEESAVVRAAVRAIGRIGAADTEAVIAMEELLDSAMEDGNREMEQIVRETLELVY